MVRFDQLPDKKIITLSPNRSANWLQTKILLGFMGCFVLIIALGWLAVGVWLILPFAGLEMGLLAFLMYRGSYATYQKQIITIEQHLLIFEAGVYYPMRVVTFSRYEVEVRIIEPKLPLDNTVMSLRDDKIKVEFGQFLNQQDRQQTLEHLETSGIFVHSDRWWQH